MADTIELENKYTIVFPARGLPYALRYGEPWMDRLDNLHLALAREVQELREEIAEARIQA